MSGEVKIYGLKTAANREDQVIDFLTSKVLKEKNTHIYSVIRPHGMRGYIFIETDDLNEADQAIFRIPYSKGILKKPIEYKEVEHMLEEVKITYNIKKGDIVELISGPFKRESAKILRINKTKDEVVVELLGAAVPIPITTDIDSVKVIRRDSDEDEE